MGRSKSSRRLSSIPSADNQSKNIRRPIILLRRNSRGPSKCRATRNSSTRRHDRTSNPKLAECNTTTNEHSPGFSSLNIKQEAKSDNCQPPVGANFSGKQNTHKAPVKYRPNKSPILPMDQMNRCLNPQTVPWDMQRNVPVVKIENQLQLPGFPPEAAFHTTTQEFVRPKSVFEQHAHSSEYTSASLGQHKGTTPQMPPQMNYYNVSSQYWSQHPQVADVKNFWRDLPMSANSNCISEQNWQMLSANEQGMLLTGHPGISKLPPEIGHGYNICPVRTAEDREDKAEATTVDDSLTNITWLGRMGINNFIPARFDKGRREMLRLSARPDNNRRPPYSYMALIQFAINSSPNRRMTLRQIYVWIEEKFPYFKSAKSGWKNSIRHNLSLHDIFVREVSTTTKASYWTLRPDLNMRPLTLESISLGPGQKPILPHLPMCPQKYILLPVPTLCVSGMSGGGNYSKQQTDTSVSFQDSSSVFMDSGFGSDPSFMTPPNKPVNWCTAEQSYSLLRELGVESSRQSIKELHDHTLPSTTVSTRSTSRPVKRARKEPLKTLNDSLNSSLQFQKVDGESHISTTLADSSEAPTDNELRSKENTQRKENMPFDSPPQMLLSDRSFSEIINDLESPFRTLLSRNYDDITDMSSADATKYTDHYSSDFSVGKSHSKQPHSVGNFPSDRKTADELPGEHGIGLELQTSTPVCSRRSKKRPHFSPTSSLGDISTSLRANRKPLLGDTVQSSDQDDSGMPGIPYGAYDDFMNDLVGIVLKSPNRTGGILRSCRSPMPSSSVASSSNAGTKPQSESSASGNDSAERREAGSAILPSVFENAAADVLSSSFSKLLDLSGISLLGAGSYSASQLADIGDVSWSNLDNI